MKRKLFDVILAAVGIVFGLYETASSVKDLVDVVENENEDGTVSVEVESYSYDPETGILTYQE